MPSGFYFFQFVMVKSSSLFFAFSVPLTIKWHLSKFSLSLFYLNQLKSAIDSSSSDLVTESILVDRINSFVSSNNYIREN